jgi:hypothetical protein
MVLEDATKLMAYLSLDPSSKHLVLVIVMGNQPMPIESDVFSKILIMLQPDTPVTCTEVWFVVFSLRHLSLAS